MAPHWGASPDRGRAGAGILTIKACDQPTIGRFNAGSPADAAEVGYHLQFHLGFPPIRCCPRLVILNSQPYLLGPAELADGVATGIFLLPPDLPAGWHTLTVVALDADGREVSVSQPIYIWPEGSNLALIAIGVGLLILLAALILRWTDRRRTRTASTPADPPKEASL